MADLDVELSRRLSQLAAAVPTSPGRVGPVTRGAIRARHSVRLAWITPLVVLVVTVAVFELLDRDNLGAANHAPSAPSDGPISNSTTSGEFVLAIRSAKAVYQRDEAIDLRADLTFTGSQSVVLAHALGAARSPLGFGIAEPIVGDLVLTPGWDQACAHTSLSPGASVSQGFAKSGGFSDDNPMAQAYHTFMVEPGLRLPAGTWHVYAVAEFAIGDCGADLTRMRVDLTIQVTDGSEPTPTATSRSAPDAPGPTPTGENGPLENGACNVDCTYWIGIRSDHRIYRESDPISIVGTFKYIAHDARDVGGLKAPTFSIREPVHGIHLDGIAPMDCNLDHLVPGAVVESPFYKTAGISTLDPDYELQRAYLDDPVLRLPPGSWHISAGARVSDEGCRSPEERFSTEIEITVLPDGAARMDLLTAAERSSVGGCRNLLKQGPLVRNEGTGLGIELQDGTVQRILWPYGYSAWDTPDGAVLIDDVGRTFAREGQIVVVDGMDEPGWLVRASCIRAVVLID